MRIAFPYDQQAVNLEMPDNTIVYESHFPASLGTAEKTVGDALQAPVGMHGLVAALQARRAGKVVIVVSDITRPIPYAAILPALLKVIESNGVARQDIVLLIATGMHRPSTPVERVHMFGAYVTAHYQILDHDAEQADDLVTLPGKSWSGSRVCVNRHFLTAGFRIITGLVEPHFMAGFSGGRKAVCPGLVSLETVQQFHGYAFLANTQAGNGQLEGNPCHEEALSVAMMAGVDFSLNLVVNKQRDVVRAFAGELTQAHAAACAFVRDCCCPRVVHEADMVVTSSGGYPLDATFYQCVKGFVACLPAVKPGGIMLACGGCRDGIGSREYAAIMQQYAGRWREFLSDIGTPGHWVKDQWQFQMHTRALEKLGERNMHFVSAGLQPDVTQQLAVQGMPIRDNVADTLQSLVSAMSMRGMTIAAIPEGPYCAPI